MRRGHFIILLSVILIAFMSYAVVANYQYRKMLEDHASFQSAVRRASDVAAEELRSLDISGNVDQILNRASEQFFLSLLQFCNSGGRSFTLEELQVYMPILAVTTDEGIYINSITLEHTAEGGVLKRAWSECLPYIFSDDSFAYRLYLDGKIISYHKTDAEILYTKKSDVLTSAALQNYYGTSPMFSDSDTFNLYMQAAVTNSIETQVGYFLNSVNYVLGELRQQISFTCPSILSAFPNGIQSSFFAIYQGLPYDSIGSHYANGISSASYVVSSKTAYYVVPAYISGFYYAVAHKEGCLHFSTSDSIGLMSREEAIKLYGTYGCPYCMDVTDGFPFMN